MNTIYVNRDATLQFQDQLRRQGIIRTSLEIDLAIEGAMGRLSDANGWEKVPAVEYGSHNWFEIVEDVCESLDLDYDEAEGL